MELDTLKKSWQSNDAKLEKTLTLNIQGANLAKTKKLASRLTSLFWQRVVECLFHAAAIVLLVWFIITNLTEAPYALSATALLAFYLITLINAWQQIKLIKSVDVNNDLVSMQSSLVMLQTHIVNYAKMTFLFIPSFLAYPVILTKLVKDFNITAMAEFDIISKSNGSWWTLEIVMFLFFIPAGIWFYNEVNYKNIDKQWVKNFIEKSSGKWVTNALVFLKELQEMK